MNLDELRTFLAIIETGSFVGAARHLNVTPSTVTARINGLEVKIGQKLLHRQKSGAELTSPGFKFQRYAEVMVQLWGQARAEVSLPKDFDGVCNVGLEFDLWRGLGQRFLHSVRMQAPGVAVALWPGEQRMLDRWLSIGLVDIAFCFAPQPGDAFVSRVLFEDKLVMMSRDAEEQPILDSSYVYVDHGDEFRRQHAAAFPGNITSALTIASSDWALDYIIRTGGMGYLPRRYAEGSGLHLMAGAPVFARRVYVVEKTETVSRWSWYQQIMADVTATGM